MCCLHHVLRPHLSTLCTVIREYDIVERECSHPEIIDRLSVWSTHLVLLVCAGELQYIQVPHGRSHGHPILQEVWTQTVPHVRKTCVHPQAFKPSSFPR